MYINDQFYTTYDTQVGSIIYTIVRIDQQGSYAFKPSINIPSKTSHHSTKISDLNNRSLPSSWECSLPLPVEHEHHTPPCR